MKTAGIYIHIPFCESKCNYCDYYCFEKRENEIGIFIEMLHRDIELTAKTHDKKWIFDTIYFGGGSPAILTPKNINIPVKIVVLNVLAIIFCFLYIANILSHDFWKADKFHFQF